MRSIVLTIIISSSLMLDISAQSLVTDRPDQTESASVVSAGYLQIESGFMYEVYNSDFFISEKYSTPSTLFRLGLANRLELRILSQLIKLKSRNGIRRETSGIGDIELGLKYLLTGDSQNDLQLALLTDLIIPSGTQGVSDDQLASVTKLAVAYKISEKLSAGSNLGYYFDGEGWGEIIYSLVAGYSISGKMGLFSEIYGGINEADGLILNYNNGITFLLKENFQLDFSFGTGLSDNMNFIGFGFSWMPGREQ